MGDQLQFDLFSHHGVVCGMIGVCLAFSIRRELWNSYEHRHTYPQTPHPVISVCTYWYVIGINAKKVHHLKCRHGFVQTAIFTKCNMYDLWIFHSGSGVLVVVCCLIFFFLCFGVFLLKQTKTMKNKQKQYIIIYL